MNYIKLNQKVKNEKNKLNLKKIIKTYLIKIKILWKKYGLMIIIITRKINH